LPVVAPPRLAGPSENRGMIEGAIRRVFDAMRDHNVACLLMGGQACVIYGAAEFSKDVDFAVLSDRDNLEKVGAAMESLRAEVIAVPPFEPYWLDEGLAVHFRCHAEGVAGMRVDLMTRMRGVEDFPALWERRFPVEDGEGGTVYLMNVRDLVAAKKTQRDKDWPMIQRLMEVRYLTGGENPPPDEVEFWLRELRTPELLVDVAGRFPAAAEGVLRQRPLIELALAGNRGGLEMALVEEMLAERERDRNYWVPLKARLAELRQAARKTNGE
jgi:hypothetical protein